MMEHTFATFAALLLAGLTGSLHCIGMCGPILIGFSQALRGKGTRTADGATPADGRARLLPSREELGASKDIHGLAGASPSHQGDWATAPSGAATIALASAERSLFNEFLWYHLGRIWTYGLLGAVAGFVGPGLREGSAWLGWQQSAGIALGILTVLTGVVLLGVVPGVNLDRIASGCAFKRFKGAGWFQSLLRTKGAAPRLLLGAIMGLLPCGLVYAMLVVVAALPTPWHSALGMVVFGIGTVPALSAVLAASRMLPAKWRAHGTRLAAALVVVAGVWMTARSMMTRGDECPCHVSQLNPSALLSLHRFA